MVQVEPVRHLGHVIPDGPFTEGELNGHLFVGEPSGQEPQYL